MGTLEETLAERRRERSRLAAPSGVATGSALPVGSRLSPPSSTPSALQQAGHALSFATSGRTFIQDLTGFDIERLPKALSMPLDFVVNPLGIASVVAAIPSGGTSLAGLGARGIGARAGGAIAKDIAGGLAGTAAGNIAADLVPGPDWLKTGVALAAGIGAGGATAGAIGRRLPKAMQSAGDTLSAARKESVRLNKRYDQREFPVNLEDADLELDKYQQLSNTVKSITGKGVLANQQTTPILDKASKSLQTGRTQLLQLQHRYALAKADPELFIKDTDSATMIQVGLKQSPGADGLELGYVPIADAAAHPSLYQLSKKQEAVLRGLSKELKSYHTAYRSVGGRVGLRADIEDGGFYLPRGIEDEFPGMPYKTKRGLVRNPDAARGALYTSQSEGIANGVTYPKFEDVLEDYVVGMTDAAVGRSAANQLAKITDAEGNHLLRSAEELVPQTLTQSYLNAEAKQYGLEGKLDAAQETKALLNAQLTTAAPGSVGDLTQRLVDVDQNILDLQAAITAHEPILSSVKDAYSKALAAVKTDPSLGSVESNVLPLWIGRNGEKLYGPREATDAINAQLNPDGYLYHGRKIANSVSSHMRVLHTMLDISDFGRLVGTSAVMHPFDFLKGIQTGFKSFFNPTALAQEFKNFDTDMRANRLNVTVKDLIKYGEMPITNLDVDLKLLNKFKGVPGYKWLERSTNLTQNGITSMRLNMIKSELLTMQGAGRTIDEDAITEAVKNIKLITGAAIHKPVPGAEMFIQFPNWLQSQFEYVGHAAMGIAGKTGLVNASPQSKYAANSMIRLAILGMASVYTVNAMGGKKTEYNNGVPVMRIGDTKIDVFGPYGALVRGMVAATNGDTEALIRSRLSPLFQIGWDLGTGKTYMGDVASFDDPEYWAKAFAPFSATSLANGFEDGNKEITLLQGAGVRASKVNSFQLLREQAQEIMGMDWADLSGKQKEQLRQANPELVADLQRRTVEKAGQGDKYAQAALATEEVNNNLLDQQLTLNELVQKGEISAVQFREALRAVSLASAERKQQIRKDYGLDTSTKVPGDVQQALNNYYGLYTRADSGILEGGVKTGVLDWNEFDKLEAELFQSLTPIQRKAIEDRFVRRDPSLDWYYANQELINESGYFEVTDAAMSRFSAQIKAFDPSIETYTDLKQAYQKAEKEGDIGRVLRTRALINLVTKQTTASHKLMTLQNPLLYKALVQNGYIKQAASRPLAANIQ